MEPEDVATVVVAGATGGTGRALVRLLAPRVTVRALTRSPDEASTLHSLGADEVVVEDLLDPTDLPGALAGADAALSAVGSSVRGVVGGGPYVDGAGTEALVAAAVDADVGAVVMESAIGVGGGPASPLASAFDLVIGPVQRAKADGERALRDAPLRHTILRPGVLTTGPRTDDVTVAHPGAKLWGTVSRADVARLMAAAVVTDAAADETFEVVATPSFPESALSIDWRLPGPDRDAVPVEVDD